MGTDLLYGVGAQELADLAGVHLSTARRWKRTGKYPRRLKTLLAVLIDGDLGPISRAWRGWSIRGDRIVSPEGWSFTFGEIRTIPFLHGQVALYKAQMHTNLQADWIDERYVEPKADVA